MLLKIKPKKIKMYTTSGKKTCAQVRAITGADIVINGSLYNFNTYKPTCVIKFDGKVVSDDGYGYWGYGWNSEDSRMKMVHSNQKGDYTNFISCVALLKEGKSLSFTYNKDVGGSRGRTAIGYLSDGSMIVYCYQDGTSGACTPETLQSKMKSYGCVDALMLDGGGSSQISSIYGSLSATRKVANWMCIWVDKTSSSSTSSTSTSTSTSTTTSSSTSEKCPYSEPVLSVKSGSTGTAAKWVQWHLNKVSNANLAVDGAFGSKSVMALKAFQAKHGLTIDGICGANTRKALKAALTS